MLNSTWYLNGNWSDCNAKKASSPAVEISGEAPLIIERFHTFTDTVRCHFLLDHLHLFAIIDAEKLRNLHSQVPTTNFFISLQKLLIHLNADAEWGLYHLLPWSARGNRKAGCLCRQGRARWSNGCSREALIKLLSDFTLKFSCNGRNNPTRIASYLRQQSVLQRTAEPR